MNQQHQQHSWLDVKVIYIRIAAGAIDEASTPEQIQFCIPARAISSQLEVNGARISPAEEVCLNLRRDRIVSESAEATFVSTDNLRLSTEVSFDLLYNGELLVTGNVQSRDFQTKTRTDDEDCVFRQPLEWNLECFCSLGINSGLLIRSSQDFSAPVVLPSLEVCIVGKSNGAPVMLTQTVCLASRRRNARKGSLGIIPEAEEMDKPDLSRTLMPGKLDTEIRSATHGSKTEHMISSLYDMQGSSVASLYGEVDEAGEMSWFNAGVRVGVGIGLGMCLGVGIGVGLLVRTYQTTTRSFRRQLF